MDRPPDPVRDLRSHHDRLVSYCLILRAPSPASSKRLRGVSLLCRKRASLMVGRNGYRTAPGTRWSVRQARALRQRYCRVRVLFTHVTLTRFLAWVRMRDTPFRSPESHGTGRVPRAEPRWFVLHSLLALGLLCWGVLRRGTSPVGVFPGTSREVASRKGPEEVARCQCPTCRVSRPPLNGDWGSC